MMIVMSKTAANIMTAEPALASSAMIGTVYVILASFLCVSLTEEREKRAFL